MRSPFVMVHKHFAKLPGLAKPAVFNCPRIMARRHCPVCAAAEKLKGTGSPADYELASDLYPQLQVYVNVIDRDSPEMGPQKLQIGKKIHEQLVKIRADKRFGGDFTNPGEDGFDIIIEREGQGKNDTKYSVKPDRNSSPLAEDADTMNTWIESQVNLLQYARVPTDAEIQQMLAGAGGITGGTRGPAPERGAGRQPAPRAAGGGAVQGTNVGSRPVASGRRATAADDMDEVDNE